MRVLALVFTFTAGLCEASNAQSTNKAMESWGLLGTWALDCDQPPASANAYLTYAIRRGKPVLLRDFGKQKDEADVLAATVAPDGSLELRVRFPGMEREYALIRRSERSISPKYNRGSDGTYTIFDGKLQRTGEPAPATIRCR